MTHPHATKNPPCIYYIRHGETEWSQTGQHTGTTDIPLTENGRNEALELKSRLADVRFNHVFTSPRARAKETCAIVGLAERATTEPDLAEWNYGDYEGVRSVTIRETRPEWNIYRDGCPNGEMPLDICNRADRLIAHLTTLEGNIAMFSHGQFGVSFAMRWVGLPLEYARRFTLSTASLSILTFDPNHPDTRVIALWNYISPKRPVTKAHTPTLTK